MNFNAASTTFVGGEVSSILLGRSDIDRFPLSAEVMENFVVHPQGPVSRRLGTRAITFSETGKTTVSSQAVFANYSPRRDTSEVLMFTAGAILVVSLTPIVNVTVTGTVTIPYTASELSQLQFVQTGNDLYVTHPNHPPAVISQYGIGDWRYEIPVLKNGPYMAQTLEEESIALSLSNVTDRVTITCPSIEPFKDLVANQSWVEYAIGSQFVVGMVVSKPDANTVILDCVEERCFAASKEVYVRGRNVTAPDASPFVDPGFGIPSSQVYYDPLGLYPMPSTYQPVFSNSFVVTTDTLGNFLRTVTKEGRVAWVNPTVSSAPTSGPSSYGASCTCKLLAGVFNEEQGNISSPKIRGSRTITGTLTASTFNFFNLVTDIGRWFRLVIGERVLNARVISEPANLVTFSLTDGAVSSQLTFFQGTPEAIPSIAGVVNWTAHGKAVGSPVVFFSTGAMPSNVTAGQTYYVQSVQSVNQFKISATSNGLGLFLGVGQTGVQYGNGAANALMVKWPAHGKVAGNSVNFFTTGTLPTGITQGQTYYVRSTNISANSLYLTTTVGGGGASILGSNIGTGVHSANNTTSVRVEMSEAVPVTVTSPERADSRSGTTQWQRGSFYTGNYPATLALHEQRFVFGGSYAEPNTLWFSKTFEYNDFATVNYQGEVLDSSGITVTLASSTLNEIYWLSSRGSLMVGTAGAEWSVTSASTREALTPTNVKAEQQSSFGSIYTQGIVAARSTMFIQGGGNKVREMLFDVQSEAHIAADATIFADHILRAHGGGRTIAYQQLSDSRIYVVCEDGQLAVLTYEPDQKVYAWSRYIIGGNGTNAIRPKVNALAISQKGTNNLIYLNVTRRDGSGVEYSTIETLDVDFQPTSVSDKSTMIFMDGYYSVPMSSTHLTGAVLSSSHPLLSVYRGYTVCMLIDNIVYSNVAIPASGNVTLPADPATRLIIGFPYTSNMTMLPMEIPNKQGTSQSKTSRISQMAFRLLDTLYFEHGPLNRPCLPSLTENGNLFSGDIRVPYDQPHDRRSRIQVSTSKALPLTIQAIYPEINQTQ